MERVNSSEYKNMKITLFLWLVLGTGTLVIMLYAAMHKTIVIADASKGTTEMNLSEQGGQSGGENYAGKELEVLGLSGQTDVLRIPLPANLQADAVVMENRYMEQELWVHIQDTPADFYEGKSIAGDENCILRAFCESQEKNVVLKLQMTGVFEYISTMEEDTLFISCHAPGELFDKIVVIDPCGGGSELGLTVDGLTEKELALQVAKLLPKAMEQDDCRIYFTRTSDVDIEQDKRVKLAAAVHADFYVEVGVSADYEHPEVYGVKSLYNENYFIPDFGNVQLADVLARNVTITASDRAIGLEPVEEDAESVLNMLGVPAAKICLGYITNEQEKLLLRQEDYQEKLAEGLANAIQEVYTNKEFAE